MVVQLIAKDKLERLQYEERCKLLIDSVSKLLLVEPFNEEYKMISAMFKWKFVPQKNILFIFAEHNFQDFVLIFDHPKICNKIYEILIKKGATSGNKELIYEKFLPKLFNEIIANNESISEFKEILLKWIEFHDGKEKEKYIQILKENNVYDVIFPSINVNKSSNPRKRKANDRCYIKKIGDKINECDAKIMNNNLKKLIEPPNFEVLKYVQNGQSKTKLSIFPDSNDRKYCYEYFWINSKKCFLCHSCRSNSKWMTAKIIKRNGKNVVKLNGIQHACEMREYMQIIEKPNFDVISLDHYQTINKGFILFFDSSRIYCYEYTWDSHSKTYYCCGCASKKLKNRANIYQKNDGTEFFMLKTRVHVCEPRKYNPGKYGEKEIVQAEDFKIYKEFRNGINKSKLVVFKSDDKSLCYEYFWDNHDKTFLCLACEKKKIRVSAELCVHDDERNYVKLGKTKHVCEPRTYDSEKFDISKKEIVESSNFKVFHFQHNGKPTSRLVVFCPTNKNLCYEYFWISNLQLYRCSNCPFGNQVIATVCQKEGLKDSLIMCKTQHICELREYDAEKYKDDIMIEKSMYKIISTSVGKTKKKSLIIFSNEEKTFYHKFVFSNQKKFYYCSKCQFYYKAQITATIENEGKENECVFLSNQKHICESIEYSLFDENYVFKSPNFQLIKRKFRGKIIQRLVVFTNDNKSECYEYTWNDKEKNFKCNTCQNHHKIYVYAKLFKNDENEECVELSKNEHKCQPIKFVPENDVHISERIVKAPDFKLYEIIFRGKNIKKLDIFDSENRKMGYVYTYVEAKKKYICRQCSAKSKSVAATVIQQENGHNYVKLNEIEHVCELQKL